MTSINKTTKTINGPIGTNELPEFLLIDYQGPKRGKQAELNPALHKPAAKGILPTFDKTQDHIKSLMQRTNSTLGDKYPKLQISYATENDSVLSSGIRVIAVLLPEIHLNNIDNQILGKATVKDIHYSNAQMLSSLCSDQTLPVSQVLVEGPCLAQAPSQKEESLSPELIQKRGSAISVRNVLGKQSPPFMAAENFELLLKEILVSILRYSAFLMELNSPNEARTEMTNKRISQIQDIASKKSAESILARDIVEQLKEDVKKGLVFESNNIIRLIEASNGDVTKEHKDLMDLLGNISDDLKETLPHLKDQIYFHDLRSGMQIKDSSRFSSPINVPCFKDTRAWTNLNKEVRENLFKFLYKEELSLSQQRDENIAESFARSNPGLIPMCIGGNHIDSLTSKLEKKGIPVIVIRCY